MDEREFSMALISLFQGPIHRKKQEDRWQIVLKYQSPIRDYIAKLNLTLVLEEHDGYCYLKQDTVGDLPRLASSYQLGFRMTVLLVLLRKRLQEFDQKNQEPYLILSVQSIQEEMGLFLQDTSDEAKQEKMLRAELKKVEEMGLIQRVKGREDEIEVLRIIRSLIDANALHQIEDQLRAYRQRTKGGSSDESI